METSSNLKSPCKKLTEKQKAGRRFEQAINAALVLLEYPMEHNGYSDYEYANAQGGPGDFWNDDMIIEAKNVWSCGGSSKRTTSWVRQQILKRSSQPRGRPKNRSVPIVPRKKLLLVSTFDALTQPAIDLLLKENRVLVEVGFPVIDFNFAEAVEQLVLVLDPIVTALLHTTTEAESLAEEAALADALLDEHLTHYDDVLETSPDFNFFPDVSLPAEPDKELFDQPSRSRAEIKRGRTIATHGSA